MINKTIVATLCVTAIMITLIMAKADPMLIYASLTMLGLINGVSIWKANHKPK